MPKGSKKRRAIKRKKETANDQPPSTNSSGIHGEDHDSSDHQATDEDLSPRVHMEAPPCMESDPKPDTVPDPQLNNNPESVSPPTASEVTLSVAPVQEQSFLNFIPGADLDSPPRPDTMLDPVPNPDLDPVPSHDLDPVPSHDLDPAPSHDLDPVPSHDLDPVPNPHLDPDPDPDSDPDHQPVPLPAASKDESVPLPATSKDEPVPLPAASKDEPVPLPEASKDALAVSVEDQGLSKLKHTEPREAVASEVLDEPSASFQAGEKGSEESLHHVHNEISKTISRDVPTVRSVPLLERHASWWNCCGLVDVFRGTQR